MSAVLSQLLALLATGAAGGVLLGSKIRPSHKLRLPISGKLVETGFLGDALLGAGLSLAVFFFAGPLLGLSLAGEPTADRWFKLLSLGVVSGMAGVRILVGTPSHAAERIAALDDRIERLERAERANDLARQAELLASDSRPELALRLFDDALQIAPHNEAAQLGKAKVLFDRSKWDDAIGILTNLIRSNPSSDRGYYARASYKQACGKYAKPDILQDLKSALTLNPVHKEHAARHDRNFENLRDDPEFRGLVA